MNNIISILNNTFQCEFKTSFNAGDYAKISVFDEGSILSAHSVIEKINYISISFPNRISNSNDASPANLILIKDAIIEFHKKLNKLGVQSAFSGKDKLHAHGLIAAIDNTAHMLLAKIDPYMLKTYEELISNIFDGMYNDCSPVRCWFDVIMNDSVAMETTDFKVSSKLSQENVELLGSNGEFYKFNDINFTIISADDIYNREGKAKVRVVYGMGDFQVTKLIDLLNMLAKTKVVV